MYCIYCGQELPADALYCSHCGRKVQSNVSVRSATPLQNRKDETEDKVVKMAVYTEDLSMNPYAKEPPTEYKDWGDTKAASVVVALIIILLFVGAVVVSLTG